jgi:hypothetical protein
MAIQSFTVEFNVGASTSNVAAVDPQLMHFSSAERFMQGSDRW